MIPKQRFANMFISQHKSHAEMASQMSIYGRHSLNGNLQRFSADKKTPNMTKLHKIINDVEKWIEKFLSFTYKGIWGLFKEAN